MLQGHCWIQFVSAAVLLAGTARAVTIDDFSIGTVVVDGPDGVSSQTDLDPTHVLGGSREIRVERTGNRAEVETVKGRFHFSTTDADHGYYDLMYGLDEPLGVDFTADGHDRIRFRFVDGGTSVIFWTYVNVNLPPSSNGLDLAGAIRAIQGSGVVEVPYSRYGADFTNVNNFAISAIRASPNTTLHIEEILTAGPPLAGDYNRNGQVDITDYNEWKRLFGKSISGGIILGADGNEDGVVNTADYTIWRDSMIANGTAALSTNVPEPLTFALMILSYAALLPSRSLAMVER